MLFFIVNKGEKSKFYFFIKTSISFGFLRGCQFFFVNKGENLQFVSVFFFFEVLRGAIHAPALPCFTGFFFSVDFLSLFTGKNCFARHPRSRPSISPLFYGLFLSRSIFCRYLRAKVAACHPTRRPSNFFPVLRVN